jgi:hypothetical protein
MLLFKVGAAEIAVCGGRAWVHGRYRPPARVSFPRDHAGLDLVDRGRFQRIPYQKSRTTPTHTTSKAKTTCESETLTL